MMIVLISLLISFVVVIPAFFFIYPITKASIYVYKGLKRDKYSANMNRFWDIYFVAWTTNKLNWVWMSDGVEGNKRTYKYIK